jgi:hypothetical protein
MYASSCCRVVKYPVALTIKIILSALKNDISVYFILKGAVSSYSYSYSNGHRLETLLI